MRKYKQITTLLTVLLALGAATPARAGFHVWTGAVNGNWDIDDGTGTTAAVVPVPSESTCTIPGACPVTVTLGIAAKPRALSAFTKMLWLGP